MTATTTFHRSPGKPVRVLFAERISFDHKERSDSIERQDKRLTDRASEERAAGWDIKVVGAAEDRSVSGDVDMFDRDALGKWLTEEGLTQWDELWVTNQDRLSRDDTHVMAFVFKCLQWGKSIVILDDPSFTEKMQTVEGRVIIHAQSIGPAKELERIKQRTKESFEARLYTIAWTAGIPSYGYISEIRLIEISPGKWKERSVKVVDPHCKAMLHWMRNRLVEDPTESLEGLCQKMEAAEELTVRDRWRERKKRCQCKNEHHEVRKCPKRERWRSSNLKVILTNDALRGVKKKDGKVLHWPDGSEVLVAEPIFNKYEWETLQTAIKEREVKTVRVKTEKTEPTPLLGVSHCYGCKKSATRGTAWSRDGKTSYRYYRCMNRPRCPAVSIPAELAEAVIEETFLFQKGKDYVPRKEWQPGSDNTEELEELRKKMKRLQEDRDAGLYDSETRKQEFQERMRGYLDTEERLAAQPQQKAGWKLIPTGELYETAWDEGDQEKRRHLLMDAGIKLWVKQKIKGVPQYEIQVPSAAKYVNGEYDDRFADEGSHVIEEEREFQEFLGSVEPLSEEEQHELLGLVAAEG
ncbi:recombinase family protein [Streptomyces cinnamoneus]|uniref:recombinase family protein n=1 Tax=Streptomyces cinnamoneus TaxID=53446 RepID=UPI0033D2F4B1